VSFLSAVRLFKRFIVVDIDLVDARLRRFVSRTGPKIVPTANNVAYHIPIGVLRANDV